MGASGNFRDETAASLAERIRRKQISPVEAVEQAISRIEAGNPRINAVVLPYFDEARKAAQDAELAVLRGAALGALHGVPIAIKDLFDFKPGWVSTFGGIRTLRDYVMDGYCAFTGGTERAGAIIVGRTNSPTFGFRGVCDNHLFGPTCNPFDLTRNSGGSSGGGAAAVAAGFLPICEGTDGGGSIRIPASWCGVYGYKASFGRVPVIGRPNGFGHTNPFIFEGPITRTVEDAALSLNALAGNDSRDPFSIDTDEDFTAALQRPLTGMKIGYTRDFGIFPIDPKVTEIVDKAVLAFEEAGAHVEEVDLGIRRSQRELSDLWCRYIAPLNLAAMEGGGSAVTSPYDRNINLVFNRFATDNGKGIVIDFETVATPNLDVRGLTILGNKIIISAENRSGIEVRGIGAIEGLDCSFNHIEDDTSTSKQYAVIFNCGRFKAIGNWIGNTSHGADRMANCVPRRQRRR